ncbi:hypothetical protein BDD12DRAFT_884137 [Trichophaea hybrida]|nr:hypothetical protein BDD12DRAFT_884137 [Trichophaea hybrida]
MGRTKNRDSHKRECRWAITGCPIVENEGFFQQHEPNCRYRAIDPENPALPLWTDLVNYFRHSNTTSGLVDRLASIRNIGKHLTLVQLPEPRTTICNHPYTIPASAWCKKEVPTATSVKQPLAKQLREELGDAAAHRLLSQMEPSSEHAPGEVLKYLNLKCPKKIIRDHGIRVPKWVTIEDCMWNITPKHAFTDMHQDLGLDTVCFPAGGRKIWLFWKPEEDTAPQSGGGKRMNAFYDEWARVLAGEGAVDAADDVNEADRDMDTDDGRDEDDGEEATDTPVQFGAGESILEHLAGGFKEVWIGETTGEMGLYSPAGWQHAVFTVEGGYLWGYSFFSHQHVGAHIGNFLGECNAALRISSSSNREDGIPKPVWAEIHTNLELNLRYRNAAVCLGHDVCDMLCSSFPKLRESEKYAAKIELLKSALKYGDRDVDSDNGEGDNGEEGNRNCDDNANVDSIKFRDIVAKYAFKGIS